MKLTILFSVFLIVSSAAVAEEVDWCLTVTPSADPLKSLNIEHPYPHEMNSAVIRIFVHLVRRSDGTGGITSQQADEQLEWLYDGFAPYGISFIEIGRDEVLFSGYDMLHWESYGLLAWDRADAIDIFLTEPNHIRNLGNAFYVPSTALLVSGDRMFNEVIVHEMGHSLGLYHTFEESFGAELPDGSNCEIAGDLVCDTAACTSGGLRPPLTDPQTCQLTPLFRSVYPAYNPDPTNYMVYAPIHCFEHFTDEQVDRMYASLETIPILQAVVSRSSATFANYSTDTELNYTGMPYSSVGFDYDSDAQAARNLEDLMITINEAPGQFSKLFRAGSLSMNGVPVFSDVSASAFSLSDRPQSGLGGIAVADMDNDGDLDMFCASGTTATPRLYRNNGDGSFADVTAVMGLDDDATYSWAGAWGDYDGDGWVDLFLSRAGEGGQLPALDLMWQNNYLMRNRLSPIWGTGGFENVTAAVGMTGGGANSLPSIAATWGDVNNDGRLDLYVAHQWLASGARGRLFIQQSNGTFVDEGASRLPSSALAETAVKLVDMDLDGDQDLVVGKRASQVGVQVYWNDGSGSFGGEGPLNLNMASDVSGIAIWDHDLDLRPDVLVTGAGQQGTSRFFHNQMTETGLVLNDETYHVGIDEGSSSGGLVLLDWNRDGDKDAYLGREVATGQFFYRAEDQDGVDLLGRDFVCVRLSSPQGVNNQAGIGARVSIQIDGVWYHQWIDGGSGRGGQDDLAVTFPVPVASGTQPVQVRWPNGWVQDFNAGINRINEDPEVIVDNTNPTVIGSSVTAAVTYDVVSQQFYWLFTWLTEHSCDWSLDKVTIGSSTCMPAAEFVPGVGGVTQTGQKLANGKFQHQLKIPALCEVPCTVPYTVTSAHRPGLGSTSSTKTLKITFCPHQQ